MRPPFEGLFYDFCSYKLNDKPKILLNLYTILTLKCLHLFSKCFQCQLWWYRGLDMLVCNGRQLLPIFLVPRQFPEIVSTVHVHGMGAAGKTNGSLSRQKRFPEEYHQLMPETARKGTHVLCMYRKCRKSCYGNWSHSYVTQFCYGVIGQIITTFVVCGTHL